MPSAGRAIDSGQIISFVRDLVIGVLPLVVAETDIAIAPNALEGVNLQRGGTGPDPEVAHCGSR